MEQESTLLSLISGDHLRLCKSNQSVWQPSGEGESIWELKQKIGTVTAELQVGYRQPISALKVAFRFDSIGSIALLPVSRKQLLVNGCNLKSRISCRK